MVDSEETCIVVMVYNTADSWGVLIGDTVVIPEPQVKRQSVTHKDQVGSPWLQDQQTMHGLLCWRYGGLIPRPADEVLRRHLSSADRG